ncbi:protein-glutamine gamma-glutamyltransferase [Bacillus tianshenii]|uniref:Protein-glutamine gamma-glutamyltransferase n=1 Tax=Sutcliffiella tianshenii TaxID=1463404 RepID=A0ABS2NYU3_9BACI|nr:protein-glutamine gamma-glutamyltransferase [Bacillus tianshenii]MBM7619807.1 protein-glutamine gamma-glutamyltransferase [Bacillus tianshenii]
MIQLSGKPFDQTDLWPPGSMDATIVQSLMDDPETHSYDSMEELQFELTFRKNIISSAELMSQGEARFETFAGSVGNPDYWGMTTRGAFQLRDDAEPAAAIQDIFKNSSLYAYECATAMIMIYYHAALMTIGEKLFNQLFENLYLYSWHTDVDLGVQSLLTKHLIPGDVAYFNNPDYHPETPWWRGENAIVMGDGMYFGHGIGIKTAQEITDFLNSVRQPDSTTPAALINLVARPSIKHLYELSKLPRGFNRGYKAQHFIIHHNKTSISFYRYLCYLYKPYYR